MQTRTPLIVGGIAAGAMIVAIIYGMVNGEFVDGLQNVLGEPWGLVTFVDLAAGLVVVGAWIGWREPSIGRAVPWWIGLALTGNLATGLYIINAARRSSSVAEFLTGGRR